MSCPEGLFNPIIEVPLFDSLPEDAGVDIIIQTRRMTEVPNQNIFRQTNAFAMQYGIWLGLWGILSLCLMVVSLRETALSSLSSAMFPGSLVLAGFFAFRFRRSVMTESEGFAFKRGFIFTLMLGFYACLWIALFVFLYLAYWDNGAVFNAYEQFLNRPELSEAISKSGILDMAGGNVSTFVDALRSIPPAQYAGMIIYITILSSPVISAIIALIVRRRKPVRLP